MFLASGVLAFLKPAHSPRSEAKPLDLKSPIAELE